MNSANFATCSRILLIPLIVMSYYSSYQYAHLLAAVLFSIASLTDWLDGYLARKLNQASEFGAFLDPVADKVLVAVVLIMLVAVYPGLLLATAIIIVREILVSALREWMASQGQRDAVAVKFSGKLKTTVQMIAIIILLLATSSYPQWIWLSGYLLLNVSAILSLWSMFIYFKSAWPVLFTDEQK